MAVHKGAGLEAEAETCTETRPPPHLLRGPGVVVVHKGDAHLGEPAQQAGGAPAAVPQPVVLGVLHSLLQDAPAVCRDRRWRGRQRKGQTWREAQNPGVPHRPLQDAPRQNVWAAHMVTAEGRSCRMRLSRLRRSNVARAPWHPVGCNPPSLGDEVEEAAVARLAQPALEAVACVVLVALQVAALPAHQGGGRGGGC